MKATVELCWALRRASKRILDPHEGYQWNDGAKCNCGLLVRELMGLTAIEMMDIRNQSGMRGCWSAFHNVKACIITGIPMEAVIATLAEVGVTRHDFLELEFCAKDGRCALPGQYDEPHYVARFFEDLADRLEGELGIEPQWGRDAGGVTVEAFRGAERVEVAPEGQNAPTGLPATIETK